MLCESVLLLGENHGILCSRYVQRIYAFHPYLKGVHRIIK